MAENPVEQHTAYHLVAETWFHDRPDEAPYLPEAYEQDGFVHLTHAEDEVMAVGNRYYRDDPRPYLLLTIDLNLLTADVRYDDDTRQFPHVYGPLDREAIVAVRQVARADDGTFTGIA